MQNTRQEILNILKEEKQVTVEDLAGRLRLTPMTIRHHLNVLQAQNLVAASKVRHLHKVGRPRLMYALTEAADELFPQGYDDLALHLLSEVKDTLGAEETRSILERIATRVAGEAPSPVAGQSFAERLEQICNFMNSRGFLFRWEKTDEGYVISNANCPYRQVVLQHGELCLMDSFLLERLLGVRPRPLSSVRDGDAACTALLVPPAGG